MAVVATKLVEGANNVSATSLVLTLTGDTPLNSKLVLFIACDNASNSGFGGDISDVIDSNGNEWYQRVSGTDGNTTNDGVSLEIWETEQNASPLTTGDTVTINFNGAHTAKAAQLYQITSNTANTYVETIFDARGPSLGYTTLSSITTVSFNSGDILFGVSAGESNTGPTDDGDTTNGTWTAGDVTEANSGSATSSVFVHSQIKTITGSGTQTFNLAGQPSEAVISWIGFRATARSPIKHLIHAEVSAIQTTLTTGSFFAAKGDLIFATAYAAFNGTVTPTLTCSDTTVTFSLVTTLLCGSSGGSRLYIFAADQHNHSTSGKTVTVTLSGSPSGITIDVYAVKNVGKTGAAAIKQFATDAYAASQTVTVSMSSPTTAGNPLFGVIATLTDNSSSPPSGWIEVSERSFSDAGGGDLHYICASTFSEGATTSSIAWTTTDTDSQGIVLEFDTSGIRYLTRSGAGDDSGPKTTFTHTVEEYCEPGAKLVLAIAADNSGGASVMDINSVTDSKGNTWTKRIESISGGGGADLGVQAAIFDSNQNAGALIAGDTITITFGSSVDDMCAVVGELHSVDGEVSLVDIDDATFAASTSISITSASLTSGDAVFAAAFWEFGGAGTFTGDSDTTNGSWSPLAEESSHSSNGTASISLLSQTKIVNAAGTQTYNSTHTTATEAVMAWAQYRVSASSASGPTNVIAAMIAAML